MDTPAPAPTSRAAVTAAVLLALELAAELLPVRVWGVVDRIGEETIEEQPGQRQALLIG